MSKQLTEKYENEIMELLKPLFKDDIPKESFTIYKNLVGTKLVGLKTDIVKLVFKEIRTTT